MDATRFSLEVRPTIPARLSRLTELADDLRYSWDAPTRDLFRQLDQELWRAVGHNPKVFLRRVNERRLREAAADTVYLDSYDQVLTRYDAYREERALRGEGRAPLEPDQCIAYFSAEFGFHESFPTYSGGLGILAGDHCKAASDLALPFVGIGILYRQGYFHQTIDRRGDQIATYIENDFDDLPIAPARTATGQEARVFVPIGERDVALRVWEARVGRVRVLFLDSDLPDNVVEDRQITYRLYGGDLSTRIKQEIVLGIGGVRALRTMGIAPAVWHVNEGHAAFSILERCRELVRAGLHFGAAMESCAASTVFTTHTAVPAGHDVFPEELVDRYLHRLYDELGVDRNALMAVGRSPHAPGFNQTVLAVRGSRFQNGVSRVHRDVSARLLASMWPQVPPAENPISFVTNGVHVGTFLAREWWDMFDRYLGREWVNKMSSREFWNRLEHVPDDLFWSVHQILKGRLLMDLRGRLRRQAVRNGYSDAQLARMLRCLDPRDPNVLTVGFARRFATYKRGTLIFRDSDRLARLVNESSRPVVFVFAGKAHPADGPAQDLIRTIHRYASDPRFEGKILLVEGYDLALARHMVTGVDVWLNTPEYPLEASGTSGQKAGMNGVINLSVLDGWWDEGYEGDNGWAIRHFPDDDRDMRNLEEADTLYELLEREVVPLYYAPRGSRGYSAGWVAMAKRSMMTLLPHFSAARMVEDYVHRFYRAAADRDRMLRESEYQPAIELDAWKNRVRSAWPGVGMRRLDHPQRALTFGQTTRLEVAMRLNGLSPDDVVVECLFDGTVAKFEPDGPSGEGEHEHRFVLDFTPDTCGVVRYSIRAYPYHPALAHPHETGYLVWL